MKDFYNQYLMKMIRGRGAQFGKSRLKPASQIGKGFTLLFAVLIISITLSLSLGATNLIITQLTISRDTRESLEALYSANAGTECALFWDVQYKFDGPDKVSAFDPLNPAETEIECNSQTYFVGGGASPPGFVCVSSDNPCTDGTSVFEFSVNNRCVEVTVDKWRSVSETRIVSRGRNHSCPFSTIPPGSFERIVRVTYGLSGPPSISGTLCGIQDYSGQDIALGDIMVCPYDGTANSGWVEILADNIDLPLSGTINASTAGFGGGGGGGGGGGSDPSPPGGTGGSGGSSGVRGGIAGASGVTPGTTTGGTGGSGGAGGGSFGGGGGISGGAGGTCGGAVDGIAGSSGSRGGYQASGGQGDTSINEIVFRGSGGGGGRGGGGACMGGAGGGGAGAPGGGYVRLVAASSITIDGDILTIGATSGSAGAAGDGIVGGSAGCGSPPGRTGGAGGAANISGISSGGAGGTACGVGGSGGAGSDGAGGGVLLKAPTVAITGSVDALGGGASSINGGTVKLFTDSPISGTIDAGRRLKCNYDGTGCAPF